MEFGKTTDRINFYGVKDKDGYLSNFYPSQFYINELKWPTVEHYFQAIKFEGNPHFEAIRNASSPGKAKALGQTRKIPIRKDWEEVKIEVMKDGLRAKFTQNKNLQLLLMNTGSSYLSEHTINDIFWGDGLDDSGLNWLGKCLMVIREELRNK